MLNFIALSHLVGWGIKMFVFPVIWLLILAKNFTLFWLSVTVASLACGVVSFFAVLSREERNQWLYVSQKNKNRNFRILLVAKNNVFVDEVRD